MSRPILVLGALLVCAPASAGRRLAIDTPAPGLRAAPPRSRVIYLERCRGGCTIHQGANDARTNTSTIPSQALSTIGEFASAGGQTGAAADAEWAAIVRCAKEVYSPYDVAVTDERPAATTSYVEAIVAGRPADLGLAGDILGVAPLASDCSVIETSVSFSFANAHPPVASRVFDICWTAAQETAHAFGLDHEYVFVDGASACNDPMTYRVDCGGEKFFRDHAATCGENAPRACKCGGTQNSHRKLLAVFGAGTPITAPPTITMTAPSTTALAAGDVITASAGAQRGVARVDLVVNGFAWAEDPGATFLLEGQPDPSPYALTVPAALPDGIVDVSTVAYDDLGISTASASVTLTKGAPCASAATCATGQRCDAGKCLWDPPTGALGDACTYPQFCASLHCEGPAGGKTCTQACSVSGDEGLACPAGTFCEAEVAHGDAGVCVTGAGCCSAGGDDDGWLAGGLGVLVLGAVRRRRRSAG
jgi:MYXO-CTERM domain-containing protein